MGRGQARGERQTPFFRAGGRRILAFGRGYNNDHRKIPLLGYAASPRGGSAAGTAIVEAAPSWQQGTETPLFLNSRSILHRESAKLKSRDISYGQNGGCVAMSNATTVSVLANHLALASAAVAISKSSDAGSGIFTEASPRVCLFAGY